MFLFYFVIFVSFSSSSLCTSFRHPHLCIDCTELGKLISNAPIFDADPIVLTVDGGIEGLIYNERGSTCNADYNIVNEVKRMLVENDYNVKTINKGERS